MTAIALLRRDEIIAQVAEGKLLKSITQNLGCNVTQISKHLANDPEYQKAREIGAERRLERAYERLDECAEGEVVEDQKTGGKILIENHGNLARAREAAWRAAAWFAEREFPDRWGGKSVQVTINVGAAVDSQLAGRAEEVLAALQQVDDSA